MYSGATITPDNLKYLCGLKNGTQLIQQIPQGCTSVVVPSSTPPDNNTLGIEDIKKIKGNLPIVLIFDSLHHDDWVGKFKEDPFVFSSQIQAYKVDAIAFENMYHEKKHPFTILEADFTNALVPWLDKLKELNPNMKFGIVLYFDDKNFYSTFNFSNLNTHVDFYIINSISKEFCFYNDKQEDMKNLDQADELARLRFNFDLLGIYIASVDYDDYEGKCECQLACAKSKTFPELNIIIGASQENTSKIDQYKCISGEFPKIVH
ncbi:uncharacterized protein LOC112694031 isoform X1 [Sipha flava]|uniref:Uncharacterized protein LOC112694031 isoform X1 n=1 Tax=Sipha flava TaxID=143950 RepID=A0A8B8GPF4_9HEMI|nr:uncharacterized protein LOC112694031 isoform X1 [Sipha flava]